MSAADPHLLYLRRAARVTVVGFPSFVILEVNFRLSSAVPAAMFAVLSLGPTPTSTGALPSGRFGT